ncbi:hypothetical protein E2C01_025362 [Portunus trituberculatus]|uniref:Endonuclease/exonuclease/phosphatase domain-containing protein n=1 Tax=Portunus trituberculatus TaxID=210409 RepID=A0A5B7EFK7_PORTR|nr:hypothetical protein [Portunus trituberculatus]
MGKSSAYGTTFHLSPGADRHPVTHPTPFSDPLGERKKNEEGTEVEGTGIMKGRTFLDSNVPANYAQIKGYSAWVRKDRSTQGGGVAFCYKASLNVVVLDTPIPVELEAIKLKLGTALVDYITTNLDRLMAAHRCDNVIIIGDLNPRGIQRFFDSLLAVFNLHNHVTFPMHRSGSILDPVLTDLPPHEVRCSHLGPAGTSDHETILTRIQFRRARDESSTCTLWQWEEANWEQLQRCLEGTNWASLLQGDVDQQAEWLTEVLPLATSTGCGASTSEAPRSGTKFAIERQLPTWRPPKRGPGSSGKQVESKKRKLRGGHIGSKQWWDLVKDTQDADTISTIPPLLEELGEFLIKDKDKVDLLAQHFPHKMTVPHPTKLPPSLPVVTGTRLIAITTNEGEVRAALSALEENKAVGPNEHDIRPTLNGAQLMPQPELQILGVTFDSKLTYQTHIRQLTRASARKLACLLRMAGLLDSKGLELLYKAEIRSSLEYSCLAWGGAAPSHLAVLDKIQRRAERLIKDGLPEQQAASLYSLHSLQHRRDGAGLATLYHGHTPTTTKELNH